MSSSAHIRQLHSHGGSSHDHDHDSGDSTLAKSVCIAVTFVVAIIGYGLAQKLKGSDYLFTLGGALAAGVMLSAGLVHLMADATEELAEYSEESLSGYPIAALFAGVSFLVLVIAEKAVDAFSHKQEQKMRKEIKVNIDDSLSGTESSAHGHAHDHDHNMIALTSRVSEIQAVVVAVAINFHAIMEGLAMGSASDSEQSWKILAALASHKGLEGFALGSAVMAANIPLARFWLYGILFSLCTPLGIGIGWATSEEGESGVPGGICTALAAGTFIWMATMEFLPKTFETPTHFFAKTGCLLAGFGAMSLIAIWA